jgi:arylsulfatase A-like enzyme
MVWATALAGTWLGLVGGPWTATHRRLDLVAWPDLTRLSWLLSMAAAAALLLGGLALAITRGRPWIQRLTPHALLMVVLALLVGSPLYTLIFAPRGAYMLRREVVAEVLRRPEAWRIEHAAPAAPPNVDLISPSIDFHTDGAGHPALVMPPPCALEFDAPDGPDRLFLRLAAGLDRVTYNSIPAGRTLIFGFAVDVDAERVFEERIAVTDGTPQVEREWVRPSGGGLQIPPGARVRLETWLENDASPAAHFPAGFGQLSFERLEPVPRRVSSPGAPSLILIVQDTQRSDRLSAYGHDRPTSPWLERQAGRGLKFLRAYATSSWTWPSTASILTGLHPERHGVVDPASCRLPYEVETVAEALQSRGYTTAAFTGNPLIARSKNFHQGFELFADVRGRFRKTDEFLPDVLSWLEAHAGTRFFLYLHLVDPHDPPQPQPEALARLGTRAPEERSEVRPLSQIAQRLLRGEGRDAHGELQRGLVQDDELRRWSALYDAAVATGDDYVGRVLEHLEDLNLEGETIVVYTSDHGEELLDHGLLGHGQSLHRELVQVPLVLAGPGIPRGVVSERVVSNRHIAPTLAHLGGGRLEAVDDPLDLWRAGEDSDSAVYFSTTRGWWKGKRDQSLHGLREGRWILHHAPDTADQRLYDVEADPLETRDHAWAHPEVVAELRRKLDEHLERQFATRLNTGFGSGAATLRMLAEVGYLGENEEVEESAHPPEDDR